MNLEERSRACFSSHSAKVHTLKRNVSRKPYQDTIKQSKTEEQTITCDYAGGFFEVSSAGVYYIGTDKDNNLLPSRWICGPLYIIAKTRDESSGEWGRLLEWIDDDGIRHQWAMPLALLQGDSTDMRRELASLGLAISPSRVNRDLLTSYLQIFPVEERARCVDKLGWHGEVFVTASKSIGQKAEKIVFQNRNAIEPGLSSAGTTNQWQEAVSRLAKGNSRLVFAISTAFAPTLASLVGEDSGGFHFRGTSSSGKSTALKVSASVWGNPNRYTRLWRATANGLEGLAALHNDGLLILDELSQLDPKEAGEAAYLLANGQGKTRASKNGMARKSTRWSLFFLSAGEESLTNLMAKAGQKTNAGQEIRLADIEADPGNHMGLFEELHEFDNPAALAIQLKDNTNLYYGAVGIDWLHAVVKDRSRLSTFLSKMINLFLTDVMPQSVSGQVLRVARRFALVAAAGELATQYRLTGWNQGEAFKAAGLCFKSWLESFGDTGNREDRAILSQVRAFFESYGASRFDDIVNPNNERIQKRAGFFRIDVNDAREYYVLSEVFRKEICKGFEPRMVVKVLRHYGWIKPGRDNKSSQKPRVRGIGTPRCYVFTKQMWESEFI